MSYCLFSNGNEHINAQRTAKCYNNVSAALSKGNHLVNLFSL